MAWVVKSLLSTGTEDESTPWKGFDTFRDLCMITPVPSPVLKRCSEVLKGEVGSIREELVRTTRFCVGSLGELKLDSMICGY